MAKTDIKQRLLQKGAEIMHIKGFYGTGIKEITDAAQVPKGSFYFYFDSKNYFGLELINYYSEKLFKDFSDNLNQNNISYIDKLKSFFNNHSTGFFSGNMEGGCPLGKFALELADTNPMFKEALNLTFSNIIMQIAKAIQTAKDKGEINNEIVVSDMAGFIFAAWQGTVMLMKISQDNYAMKNFNDFVFHKLLKT